MTQLTGAQAAPQPRSLGDRITLDWERIAWLLILALALLTRLWDLGDRAMSHDESLHTFYSWKLFIGEGYVHDPMMHGPLLYHFNALAYFLFGVSDFTARLHGVVAGVLLIASPLLVRKWIGRVGAATTGTLLLISPTVMMYSRYIRHDIPVELFTVLMFIGFIRYMDDRGSRWIVLALAAAAGAITSAEMSYINGFVLVTFILLALMVEKISTRAARRTFAAVLAAIGLLLLVVAELALGGADTVLVKELDLVAGLCLTWALGAALLAGVDGRPGVWRQLRRLPLDGLLSGLAVFAVIYVLMFTTFFQNAPGWNGFWNSIDYWLAQHGVQRGSQPWYYYLLFTPMYEYAIMLPAVAALIHYARTPAERFARGDEAEASEPPSPAAWAYVPMTAAWSLGVFWIYSWAGEKMPWLIVHLAVPMSFLVGRYVSDLVDEVDVSSWRAKGWQVALLTAVGAYLLLAAGAAGLGGGPGANVQLVAGLGAGVVVLAAAAYLGRGIEGAQLRLALAAGVALLLLGLNTRDSLRANFVNDELANEYIVYAHGTPDDKDVYEKLQEMQDLKGEGDPLTVGYDNEVSWPFTWYFRRTDWYETPYYFGEKPGSVSKLKEQDVVLVGSPNYADFEPWLRDDYIEIEYRRMWWPNEGYKGLSFSRLVETLTDRHQVANLVGILTRREYRLDPGDPNSPLKSLDDWYHHADMKVFVRKDTIEQLWPVVEERPDWLDEVDTTVEVREYPRLELSPEQVYPGTAEETLAQPKGVAVAGDGTVWVLDHGAKRAVGFSADGTGGEILAEGEFEYPDDKGENYWPSAWGVEVGPEGAVYVADTWNHRVVRYQDGVETGSFGRGLAPPEDPLAMETIDSLFGPRDVAVREDGHVFFTDTGNKRIIELDASLEPVGAIGGHGTDPGQFNEPTSLAFDPETGELFVADLWNLRVQVFDRDLRPVREWPVDGWGSEEAAHKAYLDVYPGGTVAVSDPVGARIWLYDRYGVILGTLELTSDPEGLMEPIGVAFDEQARIYVASSANNRVTRFSAPEILAGAGEGEAGDEGAEGTGEEGAEGAEEEGTDGDGAEGEDTEGLESDEDSSEEGAAPGEGEGAESSPTDGDGASGEAEEAGEEDAEALDSGTDIELGPAQIALAAFLDALDPEIADVVAEALAAREDAVAAAEEAGLDERRAERLAELLAAVEAEAEGAQTP